MTVRVGIHTGTITLQATVEEYVELGGVVEDDLAGEGDVLGESNFTDSAAESVSAFSRQDVVDRNQTIFTDLTE